MIPDLNSPISDIPFVYQIMRCHSEAVKMYKRYKTRIFIENYFKKNYPNDNWAWTCLALFDEGVTIKRYNGNGCFVVCNSMHVPIWWSK